MSGCVIWLTGLSASGKTTIGSSLKNHFNGGGFAVFCGRHVPGYPVNVEHLDGDNARKKLFAGGFDKEARDQNVLRVAYVASLLEKHGVIVVVSMISPYEMQRALARQMCQNFIEVYVKAPLAVCERRDPKGLYVKARAGEISNFTGISDVYEEPISPEVVVDTSQLTVEQCVEKIIDLLESVD